MRAVMQTLARVATVKTFPGNQSLSEQAALSLVTRGSFPSTLSDADSGPDVFRDPLEGEAVRFRHDPKLNLRSYTYNSHEQVCVGAVHHRDGDGGDGDARVCDSG